MIILNESIGTFFTAKGNQLEHDHAGYLSGTDTVGINKKNLHTLDKNERHGVLSHELRHREQDRYERSLKNKTSNLDNEYSKINKTFGYGRNPIEVDADKQGFRAWYMSKKGKKHNIRTHKDQIGDMHNMVDTLTKGTVLDKVKYLKNQGLNKYREMIDKKQGHYAYYGDTADVKNFDKKAQDRNNRAAKKYMDYSYAELANKKAHKQLKHAFLNVGKVGIGALGAKKAYDYIKKKKDDKKDPHRKLKMIGAGLAGVAGAALSAHGAYKGFKNFKSYNKHSNIATKLNKRADNITDHFIHPQDLARARMGRTV